MVEYLMRKAIRRHQRSPVVIRGHQWSSVASNVQKGERHVHWVDVERVLEVAQPSLIRALEHEFRREGHARDRGADGRQGGHEDGHLA